MEVQAEKYSKGLPADLPAHIRPLPFLYQSTGVETRFTNNFDPQPRSRPVFGFHRPETLAALIPQRSDAPRSTRRIVGSRSRSTDAPWPFENTAILEHHRPLARPGYRYQ